MIANPELNFKTDYLEINNFLLHYTRMGSGPSLILIHGGGSWIYSFRHNLIPLSKNFSVYAFDMPGHGYTQAFKGDQVYNLDTVCDALIDFLNLTGLKKVHLAGHSWGGGWTVAFADRYPERVDKIILIDSSGVHRYEQLMWELIKYPFLEKLLKKLFSEKIIKKGLEFGFYNKNLVDQEMIKCIYAPLSNDNILNAHLSYSRNIKWEKIKEAMPRIRSQVLVIWGKNDRYINVKYGKQMAQLIPDAHLEIIDQCGHSAHEEYPAYVNRLITNFIG